MMLAQVISQLVDLEAFCSECPSVNEVTPILEEIGFRLAFHLESKTFAKRGKQTLPALPAQFHYRDQHGTELLFLAGKDYAEQGMVFPAHTSRWWLYPGTSQYAYKLAMQTLSEKYELDWKIS